MVRKLVLQKKYKTLKQKISLLVYVLKQTNTGEKNNREIKQ